MWMIRPAKQNKPTVTASIKAQVEEKAKVLIENVLKAKYIQPPPEDPLCCKTSQDGKRAKLGSCPY